MKERNAQLTNKDAWAVGNRTIFCPNAKTTPKEINNGIFSRGGHWIFYEEHEVFSLTLADPNVQNMYAL